MDEDDLKLKMERLKSAIKGYDSLAIAFSGGTDSTFLLAVAHKILERKVIAITAKSQVHPVRETDLAVKYTKKHGIEHIIIQSNELNIPEFTANNRDRCYICKRNLFPRMMKAASKKGIRDLAHGANTDDIKDFRPGFSAAHELGIVAPMIEAGLSKGDIRLLSKKMRLGTWNKPAMACLATRIPYGTPVTKESLKMIEKAEYSLADLGFGACRVRHHGTLARIELAREDFERMINEKMRKSVIEKMKKAGYLYVSMDLEGYIQGSMNR
ncbi:MAG: ATP-dependent sacrificial sulfur transferase LarE [Proteobacteria bacterium]|nr:ATP-dependent sacrificial sulfur transferase LarE [Pseudomonadota bacterium]